MTTMQRVEELCSSRGITCNALSLLCALPPSTLRTARRRRGELSVDTIERICQGLDIKLADFFRSWS